ncbi:MAG: hypothetical protein HY899_15490 [Deltaproteobacteria bacterium]|nr:hypothetical protein [Deltaproteobacteria bacterium]
MYGKLRKVVTAAGFVAITITGFAAGVEAASAEKDAAASAAPSEKSIYDRIWALPSLYNNPDNHWIEELAVVGRQQNDLYYVSADQGSNTDFVDRRTRIGLKARMFDTITLHSEVDLNLEPHGQTYNKLTDSYVKWSPSKLFNLTAGKHGAKFTLDGSTSSTQLITIDRSNIANNFWFPEEYVPGVSVSGEVGNWLYNAGYFSSGETNREFGKFNAGSFALVSGGYNFAEALAVDKALLRLDYVYQDPNAGNSFTRANEDVASLNFQLEKGPWGLGTDIDGAKGYGSGSDLFGFQILPSYKFNKEWQTVFRYSFIDSSDDNGIRLARYENAVVGGRGDRYNEAYLGLNRYFYGHKLKWQTGVQYASMKDAAHDGGRYNGWGITTGLRISW